MRERRVRFTDELDDRIRKAAGPNNVNGWIREAVSEKLGRAELANEVADLRKRVVELERQVRSLRR